jgi:hypothetical protein
LVVGRVDPDDSSAFKVLMGYQKDFHEWDPPGSSRGLKTRIIKESRQLSVKLGISPAQSLDRWRGLYLGYWLYQR